MLLQPGRGRGQAAEVEGGEIPGRSRIPGRRSGHVALGAKEKAEIIALVNGYKSGVVQKP